jgi:hypothetical protein
MYGILSHSFRFEACESRDDLSVAKRYRSSSNICPTSNRWRERRRGMSMSHMTGSSIARQIIKKFDSFKHRLHMINDVENLCGKKKSIYLVETLDYYIIAHFRVILSRDLSNEIKLHNNQSHLFKLIDPAKSDHLSSYWQLIQERIQRSNVPKCQNCSQFIFIR